jgi:urease accessory protein
METAIVTGEVCDAGTAAQWLRGYLATSLEYNDALAIRLAGVGPVSSGDAAEITDAEALDSEGAAALLCELSDLLEASTMAPEARRANTAIGRRMMQISGDFGVPLVADFASEAKRNGVHPHPALVAAAVGCGLGATWPEVCGLYLYSCLTSLVQNAVRAIPLGQIAGQRILAGLAGPVAATVRRTARADPGDLGSSSPMLDVLQCEHETQLGRMFIS